MVIYVHVFTDFISAAYGKGLYFSKFPSKASHNHSKVSTTSIISIIGIRAF